MSSGRVFLLESPNALDLLEGTGETSSLSKVCRLFGHDISSFLIRDKSELRKTLLYISSVGWSNKNSEVPIFIHFSSHGNDDGLAIGAEDVRWKKLAKEIIRAFKKIYKQGSYNGPIVLIISSCGSNKQKLTDQFIKENKNDNSFIPPKYIFVFDDTEVGWHDAVVAWTIFYREAPNIDFLDEDMKEDVMRLLIKIEHLDFGTIRYFRWDNSSNKYKTYPDPNRSA